MQLTIFFLGRNDGHAMIIECVIYDLQSIAMIFVDTISLHVLFDIIQFETISKIKMLTESEKTDYSANSLGITLIGLRVEHCC